MLLYGGLDIHRQSVRSERSMHGIASFDVEHAGCAADLKFPHIARYMLSKNIHYMLVSFVRLNWRIVLCAIFLTLKSDLVFRRYYPKSTNDSRSLNTKPIRGKILIINSKIENSRIQNTCKTLRNGLRQARDPANG